VSGTTFDALLQAAVQHQQALAALRRLWAYVTLGATGIITEEATPLIGGLAAHDRYLRLSMVMFSVAVGTWIADLGLYYVGRWRGRWARQRWPRLRTWMVRTFKIVRRHPWRVSIAVRWGLRPTADAADRLWSGRGVPLPVYLIGSAISCATWS
jgi:membrane protein DedA with SNARE-associated domain